MRLRLPVSAENRNRGKTRLISRPRSWQNDRNASACARPPPRAARSRFCEEDHKTQHQFVRHLTDRSSHLKRDDDDTEASMSTVDMYVSHEIDSVTNHWVRLRSIVSPAAVAGAVHMLVERRRQRAELLAYIASDHRAVVEFGSSPMPRRRAARRTCQFRADDGPGGGGRRCAR
jgi:hypothetical protein